MLLSAGGKGSAHEIQGVREKQPLGEMGSLASLSELGEIRKGEKIISLGLLPWLPCTTLFLAGSGESLQPPG